MSRDYIEPRKKFLLKTDMAKGRKDAAALRVVLEEAAMLRITADVCSKSGLGDIIAQSVLENMKTTFKAVAQELQCLDGGANALSLLTEIYGSEAARDLLEGPKVHGLALDQLKN